MKTTKLLLNLAALLALGTGTADAHASLDHASPRVGSTVASVPGQLTLTFSQRLESGYSRAEVSGPGGRVDTGSSVSGNVMHVSVKPLTPGTYHVHWRVLSVDTHKTEGSYSFTVGK
jgi:copper resistance protein C